MDNHKLCIKLCAEFCKDRERWSFFRKKVFLCRLDPYRKLSIQYIPPNYVGIGDFSPLIASKRRLRFLRKNLTDTIISYCLIIVLETKTCSDMIGAKAVFNFNGNSLIVTWLLYQRGRGYDL